MRPFSSVASSAVVSAGGIRRIEGGARKESAARTYQDFPNVEPLRIVHCGKFSGTVIIPASGETLASLGPGVRPLRGVSIGLNP